MWTWLSSEEKSRANSFRHACDRHRFILRHTFLRAVLARYLNLLPEQVCFTSKVHEKPILIESRHGSDLHFSLSSSDDRVVIALAWRRRVGVDIERVRADLDIHGIAASVFSNVERKALQAATTGIQKNLFFKIWTRKEAFVKALGAGLQYDLKSFDVMQRSDGTEQGPEHFPGKRSQHRASSVRSENALDALIVNDRSDQRRGQWLISDSRCCSGFASACCAQGSDWSLVDVQNHS